MMVLCRCSTRRTCYPVKAAGGLQDLQPPHTWRIDVEIPYGYCHCGCGRSTKLSPVTNTHYGHIKDQPFRFLKGHHVIKKLELVKALPFKINGVYCRIISLTQKQYAIVWEEDYYRFASVPWHARFAPNTHSFYACRAIKQEDGSFKNLSLANAILGLPIGQIVDHENGITLDYRRSNLRPATRTQNQWNRKPLPNKCGRRGVSKMGRLYYPIYSMDGGRKRLILSGGKETPDEAGDIYDTFLEKVRGEFAWRSNK